MVADVGPRQPKALRQLGRIKRHRGAGGAVSYLHWMNEPRQLRLSVLIAEDQYLMREGTKRLLAEVPGVDVVGEAVDYDSVLAEARRLEPDVVLMDIKMPPTHSVEGIESRPPTSSRVSGRVPGLLSSASTMTKATFGPCSRTASRGTATCTRCAWVMSISS